MHDVVKFLLTNRFHQDCLENLLSVLRSKRAQRDNPDSRDSRAALQVILFIFGYKSLFQRAMFFWCAKYLYI